MVIVHSRYRVLSSRQRRWAFGLVMGSGLAWLDKELAYVPNRRRFSCKLVCVYTHPQTIVCHLTYICNNSYILSAKLHSPRSSRTRSTWRGFTPISGLSAQDITSSVLDPTSSPPGRPGSRLDKRDTSTFPLVPHTRLHLVRAVSNFLFWSQDSASSRVRWAD